jgi:hypothetical protein
MSFVQIWPTRRKQSILFIAYFFHEWMSSLYLHLIYYHINLVSLTLIILSIKMVFFEKKIQWIIFCEEKYNLLEYSGIFYSWHENLKIHWLFYKHVLKLSLYHINQEHCNNLENIMIILNFKIYVFCTSHGYVVAVAIFFNLYH